MTMEEALDEIGKSGLVTITGPQGWGTSGWKVKVWNGGMQIEYEGKELRPVVDMALRVVRAIQGALK